MTNCRDLTTCTPENYLNPKINRVKAIFFRELVSCSTVHPYFVINASETYKKAVDFFSPYLDTEGNE